MVCLRISPYQTYITLTWNKPKNLASLVSTNRELNLLFYFNKLYNIPLTSGIWRHFPAYLARVICRREAYLGSGILLGYPASGSHQPGSRPAHVSMAALLPWAACRMQVIAHLCFSCLDRSFIGSPWRLDQTLANASPAPSSICISLPRAAPALAGFHARRSTPSHAHRSFLACMRRSYLNASLSFVLFF
jgi:hypothetical protein